MAAAGAAPDGDDAVRALAVAGVLPDVGPGAVVLVAGEGEDGLARGLAERGSRVHRVQPADGEKVGGPPPALLVLGRADPAAHEPALEHAHSAGCPFAYCRDPQALEAARRWYWCHEVPTGTARLPTLAETWRASESGAASAGGNRYGHWVGWRRILPAGQGSPGPVPASPPTP